MAAIPKKFVIGKREKIVIGALGTLFCIAVTHFILYRPKSVQLSQVNEDFNQALVQYNDFASKNLPPNEIKSLETDVKGLDDLLTSAIDKFQIGKEKDFGGGGPAFMKMLDEIKALEKSSAKPKINVLAYWGIADDIPGLEPARIPDLLDRLKQKKEILTMPNISQNLKDQFDSQYREILQSLGYNKVELDKMNPFIAWLKQVRMYFYIKNHKGASEIKDAELYTNLDIPVYDKQVMIVGMFFLVRTKDILELATQAGVETVSDVKLLGKRDIRPAVKETPPPTATPITQGSQYGGGEMGMIEGPAQGRGGFFPGLLGRSIMASPTPTPPPEPPSAISIPIELIITGDNQSITKFLYNVTHSPKLMDIREFDIVTQEEGKLTAKVAINSYRDIKAVDDLQKVASVSTTSVTKSAATTK